MLLIAFNHIPDIILISNFVVPFRTPLGNVEIHGNAPKG